MTSKIKPVLTIGIPVFNGESTLKETLDCCAKLPADLVRVIVSDNASTDGTQALSLAYAERYPHISVYLHEQNLGAANNFKYLLDNCCTEYYMWLAADDVISDALSITEVKILFEKFPRAIAVSPFAMVGPVGSPVPDRGNGSLVGNTNLNTLRFLLRPGVNSRFYSIYRTERLRALYVRTFDVDKANYFASDIVFSVSVMREGEWPMATSFLLTRKPGISSDGWILRKAYAKGFWDAVFPSARFIRQIVGIVSSHEKLPILIISSFLYFRYLIGPLKHRLSKRLKFL